ncbi:ABC transporter permease [Tumebacillus permanentifrigoris]|uniref:ABC-2 type transport system permease protein n=1 Tax=Tumebacillus permanentifrigoris TaxID=378543 RepID=A0A316D741_9BACL|nr:ABC-2 family transporter protein [Tumebacillus permanentifrigoris]PWK11355.1 ABC-2 type transport system permease protein [Tumebacillus permanentifrigoris]
MKKALRYSRLLFLMVKLAISEEMEYRSNFFANVLSTVSGLFVSLLTLQVFFNQTQAIGGWSFEQVLVLLGIFNALDGVVKMVLRPNIGRIVQHIRKGTLDLILTKPVDSQFYVSFRHILFWPITDVLMGLGLVVYGVLQMGIAITVTNLLWFALLFVAALVTLYGIWMLLMTMSFWFVKVENLTFLFTSLFETARFPVQVYRGILRALLTYVFPVAVLTTFPAAALVGKLNGTDALISVSIAVLMVVVARQFWKMALRNYTSASS